MAKKTKVGLKVPTKNEILKKYGSIMRLASDTVESNLWLPSTFFALNYTFGGGIPFGKVLEVAGEESSGKSLIAYNFAYTCQQLGGHVIWVDAEQSWMNSWAEANGVHFWNSVLINVPLHSILYLYSFLLTVSEFLLHTSVRLHFLSDSSQGFSGFWLPWPSALRCQHCQ